MRVEICWAPRKTRWNGWFLGVLPVFKWKAPRWSNLYLGNEGLSCWFVGGSIYIYNYIYILYVYVYVIYIYIHIIYIYSYYIYIICFALFRWVILLNPQKHREMFLGGILCKCLGGLDSWWFMTGFNPWLAGVSCPQFSAKASCPRPDGVSRSNGSDENLYISTGLESHSARSEFACRFFLGGGCSTASIDDIAISEVSFKMGGTSKWLVYSGESIYKWMICGYPHFRKLPYLCNLD